MSNASIWEGQTSLIPVANSFGNVFEEWQLATAAQTLFTIASFQYTPGTFTLLVFKNGLFQRPGTDYTETSSSQITFTAPTALNDRIAFYAFATSGVAIPNGGGVPAGGTAGQVLTKINSSDYNTTWTSISALATLLDAVRQNVASATTVNLTGAIATQTRNIALTGTNTITGFQIANGQLWCVTFSGAMTLTNSAAIDTKTGANLTTGVGDTCFLRATADNVVEIIGYTRALSPTLVGTGNCEIALSGANLVLRRVNGTTVPINGTACTIPSAGVTLAPTALAANTNYYIYAVATAGVVTSLEPSTTGHETNTVTGIEQKIGDPTRALVGFGRTTAGVAWVDSVLQRFVLSWYNRKRLSLFRVLSAASGSVATVYTELTAALRLEFLDWGRDAVEFKFEGSTYNNVINNSGFVSESIDGVTGESYSLNQSGTANNSGAFSASINLNVTEGYHYASPLVKTTGGTQTFAGGGTPAERSVNRGTIIG